jgi:cytoskeletal protein CcmA (bactofilin family)
MFSFSRSQRPEPDAIEVIIGPRSSFSGVLRSETSVRIDGAVEGGQIETPANVILTEGARVQCDITAKTVSIRGAYRGVIRADRVELLAGSQVAGILNVKTFYMDDGVVLQAELNMRGSQRANPLMQRSEPQTTIPVVTAPGVVRPPGGAP